MDGAELKEHAATLPREPGVYQFLADGTTLYVGKAVDLRGRVRSYADPRSARIRRMVQGAESIDFAVTDTETQALLLEANLIKRHQPRYNVRLKDDKSYPLVQLTDHEFPRIEITRDPDAAATAFGPFTNKGIVEVVVKALREVYGVRGCSDHKFSGRARPCLDHDIGLCTAPCTGEIGREAYVEDVESVERFFAGETGALADPLRRRMERAAQEQSFERAASLRDRLEAVEGFHEGRGEAVHDAADARHVDVLGVSTEGDRAIVARLQSEGGQLVDRERHHLSIPDAGDGHAGVLAAFIAQYYAERELPDSLLVPEDPADAELRGWLESEGIDLRVPGAGREATLVDLAIKNARRGDYSDDPVSALAEALSIPRPERIEGFDVSHAHGKAAVGSNVLFVGGEAETSGYRRKKLEERNDDYANMRALVRWRALRAVEGRDDRPDPDLLLIDGGDGQLDAAREALSETGWDVPAIALAKAEELVITPDGPLDWSSDATHLHLLQRVRDESHRFALQYHQTLRDDVSTVLDDVPGIGPKTRTSLLRRFGSVEGIRTASVEDLRSVEGIGEKTARTITERL
ncbi:excinuclease ABC subunit C [Halalkalicoccus jeotgali B3]|uniref:UvrABC system protein C n=1 Tax=Halalkalicoccus jeotgali (strain DSM 18796 / CECT 7217 / JCM 14584 / KCTC 4019 / B3) TaxID=795797 RepID=D8J4J7_HALJB|nr:excinuclease ABC subunit C [Halalkalicoccus jeotgali]ADJ13559.1 excinuclease ABC subunit C [Halalkalicoccus jeotgali B3]